MTKEQKLRKIEKLRSNPRITKLEYNDEILIDGREDSIWYGGYLLSCLVDNRYIVRYGAFGLIDAYGYYLDSKHNVREFEVKDKNNYGIAYQLKEIGVTCDENISYNMETSLLDLHAKDSKIKMQIEFESNNWFEYQIFDIKEDDYVVDALDNVCDFDDMFNVLEILDSWKI